PRALWGAGPVGPAPVPPAPIPSLPDATGGSAACTRPSAHTPPSRRRFPASFPGSPPAVAALSPNHSSGSHRPVRTDVVHACAFLRDEEPPEDRRDLPQAPGPGSAARARRTVCSLKLVQELPWF